MTRQDASTVRTAERKGRIGETGKGRNGEWGKRGMGNHPFYVSPFRRFIILLCFLLLASCLFILLSTEVSAEEDVPKNPDYVFAICQDVVDGNTIEVDILGMKRKLRLIGVNVSKIGILEGIKKRFGFGAVGYLQKTVNGKKLYLEFEDVWNDPSGILRGYVHLKEDNTFINLEMIKQGYASVDRKGKYKYKKEFEKMGR